MKTLYTEYTTLYQMSNEEIRKILTNSYTENLYEMVEAVSGSAVHTAAYAPG